MYAQSFQWNDNRTPTKATSVAADPLADQTGLASVYPDYYEGNPTALGEVFHQYEFTAAHPKLPLGSLVEVTRLDNGLTTNVRINDRGAFCEGCIIDLSKAAAQQLGLTSGQQARVKLTVTGFRQSSASASVAVAPEPASTPARPAGEFTAKGVSSPNPHTYQAPEATIVPKSYNLSYDQNPAPAATFSSPPATPSPMNNPARTAPSVQIIDHLPAPYAVQLGSYNRFANAERHSLRLQQAGFTNVFILQEKEVGHEPLNRVLITPFHTLSEAEDFAEELRQYHQMQALILHNKLVEISLE